MLESVHCPSCSTHYGLTPGRVRTGIRRARCFRCASIFGIEDEVKRLLEPLPAPVLDLPQEAGPELGIGPEDFLDLQPLLDESSLPVEPTVESFAPESTDASPSLTLGDLDGIEEEILEKTLVVEEAELQPAAPFAVAEPVVEPDQEPDGGTGGFTSAKDAIAKLLGNTPTPEPPHERRTLGRSNTQMDVEATLDALESTLGGVQAKDLGSKPVVPPPDLSQDEFEPAKPMASTMKLTHDEIMSAMKAASLPAPASIPKPLPSAPAPTPLTAPVPQTAAPVVQTPAAPEPEASLLKLQVGQEVYSNVSMDQITSWIEQGRVQDFHMVARQFSENWIEAGKVPALRPIFERVRRAQAPAAQQAQAVILPPPNETAPIKKSLFGGLFNRG